jgi:hypothetical protein
VVEVQAASLSRIESSLEEDVRVKDPKWQIFFFLKTREGKKAEDLEKKLY